MARAFSTQQQIETREPPRWAATKGGFVGDAMITLGHPDLDWHLVEGISFDGSTIELHPGVTFRHCSFRGVTWPDPLPGWTRFEDCVGAPR